MYHVPGLRKILLQAKIYKLFTACVERKDSHKSSQSEEVNVAGVASVNEEHGFRKNNMHSRKKLSR